MDVDGYICLIIYGKGDNVSRDHHKNNKHKTFSKCDNLNIALYVYEKHEAKPYRTLTVN